MPGGGALPYVAYTEMCRCEVERLPLLNMVCPKQGPKIEGDVLLRAVVLGLFFCLKQGQDFIPSAAPLYPNIGHVNPPPFREGM